MLSRTGVHDCPCMQQVMAGYNVVLCRLMFVQVDICVLPCLVYMFVSCFVWHIVMHVFLFVCLCMRVVGI